MMTASKRCGILLPSRLAIAFMCGRRVATCPRHTRGRPRALWELLRSLEIGVEQPGTEITRTAANVAGKGLKVLAGTGNIPQEQFGDHGTIAELIHIHPRLALADRL